MFSRTIWKTYTREFFKDFKLHSSFGLVQFRSSLKSSLELVHVFYQIALETILLPIQTTISRLRIMRREKHSALRWLDSNKMIYNISINFQVTITFLAI